MLAPRSDAPKRRPRRAKLNSSSRTKTSREDRKKDKEPSSVKQFELKIEKMIKADELLLPKLFDEAAIEAILDANTSNKISRRKRVYTVATTLSLFVQQVLVKDRGCKEVVALLNRRRQEQQLRHVSTNTTSYCDARARIPLSLIRTLVDRTAHMASGQLSDDQLWYGRRVFLVDGLVVSAPDTPENQRVYPQSQSQEPGMGFPQIRICAAICLATGVVANMKYGPVVGKKTGEQTLFRRMFRALKRGDVIVADSLFECFRDHARLTAKGVDVICDKNGTRESPFKGRCKVIEETLKVLPRPGFDKSRFKKEQWEALPTTLTVRMIRCKVGGRKSELILVTTLLDSEAYPAAEIVKLYKLRWECELDIRSIKSVMGMTWLTCHTPAMLKRELMVYILAYNIIRISMCDAAKIGGQFPRELSFKSAKDAWLLFGQDEREPQNYAWLFWTIADAPLRKRPGRNEPRKIKRRNSKYEKLKRPRDQEKAALSP
jgi:hypothetical protein